jgi:DNA-binding CsgD family transcriptional regulator
METRFGTPITCPVLIGRSAELTTLCLLADRARSGAGQIVLLSGEAGIGKSRLVAEATTYASAQGFRLLQGQCFPADRSCPYAPLLDLLRSRFAAASREQVVADMGAVASALSPLLPDLLPQPSDRAPLPPLGSAQEKQRLFAALAHLILRETATQPVLLVVEDLHWSDDTSLEFLHYLGRRCATSPMLVLLTYRSDDIHPGLSHLLAHLDRERLAQECALAPLTRSDMSAMLQAIFALRRAVFMLPPLVHGDLLDAIYTLTEGNPFIIEELLKSLIEAGDIYYEEGRWTRKPLGELRIPRSVQDAVQQRTAHLSAGAKQVLNLAAVAGRRFDFALLQRLTHHEEGRLLLLIKELVAAQLVVEESAEQFAFRHALTRQAIYAALLVRERRALHQGIARTMERLYAAALDAHLADLAYHFSEAGVWDRALAYGQRAGERAQSLYAPRAAIEQFSRAIAAARQLALAPSPQLYRARGLAYETLGDFARARADHEAALGAAREAGDRWEEWHALMALGALWAGRDYAQAGEWYRRATALAQGLGDADLHAHSLNRLGNWLINTGQVAESLSAHHTAFDLFKGLDSPEGMAETLDLLGMAHGQGGDVRTSVARLTEAIDLFRVIGDQRSLSSSLAVRAVFSSAVEDGVLFSALRPPHDCERDVAEALCLARQIDWPAGQAFAHIAAGMALGGFGRLGAALAQAQEALRMATDIEHQQWTVGAYCILGTTYRAMLTPDPAVAALETALPLAQALGSAVWVNLISAELALTHLLRGDLPRAEAVLTAVMRHDAIPPTSKARWVALAWGELALAQGHHEAALCQVQDLIAATPGQGPSTSPHSAQTIPALLKLKGEALLALGRMDEAAEALAEAERGALERAVRPLTWRVYRSLARLHRASKREAEAERAFAAARDVIAELAATIDDGPLRDGFLHAALGSLPRERPVTPLRAAKQSYGGLTAREREVAALIGQGRSNRDIAESLVLSERTVASHVGNILTKLDFTSRAQIAVWARDRGLL